MNNLINPIVKHGWNDAMYVLHNFLCCQKHNSLPLGPIQPSFNPTKQLYGLALGVKYSTIGQWLWLIGRAVASKPEVRGLNPVIGKIYIECLLSTLLNDPFLKNILPLELAFGEPLGRSFHRLSKVFQILDYLRVKRVISVNDSTSIKIW